MVRVLVGRDAECAVLSRALAAAQGRGAPVVLVSGESGAGKTTLVEHVLARTGTPVLSGRAAAWAGAAYDVLARALRPAVRDMAGPVPTVLAQIFPERGVPPATPDPAALAAGVCSVLGRLAAGLLLALFLDDLQWADQATLGLLPALADAAGDIPVVLIGCYRSDELPRDHRLRAVRAQLRRSRQLAEVDVRPLDDEDVARMLTHLLGTKPGPALAAAVASRAEGIPFAVEELALALRDGGASAAVVPDGIREAVLLRTARLSGQERMLLETAAVAGQEFDIDPVLAVCGLSAWPDGFTGAGLLTEVRDGRAAFRHSLTHEAAYADIGWSRRRDLHRELARTLAAGGAAPALIAMHQLAARDFEAAREALIEAADAHCAVHAYRDAARALRTVLEHWPADTEDDTRLAVVGRLARCAEMCSEYAEAVTLLRELADGHERRGEAAALAVAQRRLALVHELRGQWEAALTAREAAAVAFSAAGLRAEAAVDRLAVAAHLRAAGSYSAGLGTLATARADAEDSGRTDLLLRAEGLRGNLLARLGQSREGVAAVRAALDQALAASLTDTAADLQQRLADALEHAGDYRAATAVYAAAFQFCDAHGADAVGQLCRACATVVLFTRGEWDRTAAVCEDVLASAATPHARGAAAGMLGLVHAMRGAARQARPHLLESHLIATRIELVPMEMFSSWGLCVLESSAGSCAEAADRARRMLTRLARTQERHFSVLILQWMAAFFAEQGMDADVRACAAALAGMAETTGQPEAIAALAHARGETLVADEPEAALRELRRAAEKFGELELPYAAAQAQRRAARAAARIGDTTVAVELLHAAHDTAGRLGARVLRSACAAALGELGGKPRPPAAGRGARGTRTAGGLTGRELEIMLLVARGNTSRQIGEALFISPRTVEMHVQGSLLKLGCRTRAQAVRKLAELGTLPPEDSRDRPSCRPEPARPEPARLSLPALACRYRVGGRSFGAQQHHRAAGIESQRGPPLLRALAGQRGPDPGQRGPAAGTGWYPVTRQVASCHRGLGVGHGDRGVQAVTQVGPGQPGGSAAVEPGHDGLPGRDGAELAADQAGQDAGRGAGLDRQQGWRTGAWPAPVVDDGGLGQRPDSCRDRDQGRTSRPCRPCRPGSPGGPCGPSRPGGHELLVDLGEQGRVAVHDPAGYLLVAGPAGVLHEFGVRFAGRLGGDPDRIVIGSGDLGDLRALCRDRRDRRGVHAAGHEHVRPLPQQPGHPGQRASVVAVGGGHQRDRSGRVPPGQHLVNRPGGTEHLERGQAHPGRLVLHEHPADAQFGRDRRHLPQRSRRVARQPRVKCPYPGRRGGSAGPGPRGRAGEPGRAARRQARGSDHPPTMPSRPPCPLDDLAAMPCWARSWL